VSLLTKIIKGGERPVLRVFGRTIKVGMDTGTSNLFSEKKKTQRGGDLEREGDSSKRVGQPTAERRI